MTPTIYSRLSHQGRRLAAVVASLSIASVAWSQTVPADEDVFELSPFAVTTSDADIGYHSEQTLAGSRLNTNVSDLASSITIVTRQQLEDTGSLDINDIFLYEANTEGVGNYTAYEINRGGVKDLAAGHSRDSGLAETAATTNRIRGLGAADSAQNNHPTITRIPFDEYNTRSVEINRGPNSLLFGLGSPAGIVNQTTAQAMLNVQQTELVARYGSWDSYRFSFNHNQPIIDDVFAIYVAAVDDNRGFKRKPSYDDTQRQYGAFTLQPFEHTTFRGSIERYQNQNRRPNYITPRERVTNWIADGRPSYNPNTRMITYQGGSQVGPFTRHVESPGSILDYGDDYVSAGGDVAMHNAINDEDSPLFVRSLEVGHGSPWLKVHPDLSTNYVMSETWRPSVPPVFEDDEDGNQVRVRTDEQHRVYDRRMMTTRAPEAPRNPDGTLVMNPWFQPSLTDGDIYDWENINVVAPNYGELWGKSYSLDFEQRLARNLFLSVSWFRQHVDSLEQRPLAQQQATTIFVDPNTHFLDGSENPWYGAPFVEDYQADTFTQPETNDSYYAMLAYQFDLTDRNDWVRHLGRHRVLGFASRHDVTRIRTRSRIATVGGDPTWYASRTGTQSYAQNNSNIRRHYYIGQNEQVNQGNMGISNPGPLGGGGPTDFTLRTINWEGDWDEGEPWYDAPINLNTERFWATTRADNRVIDSFNLATQSYFWDERIVTTLGIRRDDFKARSSDEGPDGSDLVAGRMSEQGLINNLTSWGDWEEISGTTSTRGVVFKPFRWDGGELSLHYNESDNFNPPSGASSDFFGNELGKPEGDGKDYGVGVTLFGGMLFARVNWFEVEERNSRGVASVFVSRTHRVDSDLMRSWADLIVRLQDGGDPEDTDWNLDVDGDLIPLTDAQEARVADITGLDYNFPDGLSVDATQTRRAEGMEVQVVYNPLRNWNMKLTVGKQETFISEVAPEWDPWIDERMPVWTSATAPGNIPTNFNLRGGREVEISNFWSSYGYRGDEIAPDNQWGITNPQDWFDINVQSEVDFIRLSEGTASPGQRKWRANLITNYAFTEGMLEGVSIGGGLRWQDKAIIGYLGIVNEEGTMDAADINRPVFDKEQFHVDLWASYSRMIMDDRVRMRIQLNIRDAFEGGGLQPIAVNYDGNPHAFRIKDPRQVFITTRFEF